MDKKQKIVVIGIIENGDEVLVIQRYDPKIKDAHLKWDLPGGTNEFGESLKETLTREIKEETGSEVQIIEMLPECVSKEWHHQDYLQHTLVFCFVCKLINSGSRSKDHKVNDVKWVKMSKLAELDWLETTKVFIELYLEK